MAPTATKVFPLRRRAGRSAIRDRAQNCLEKKIPCRLRRPNKNVVRKCHSAAAAFLCKWSSGRRTWGRARPGGGGYRREKFSRYWYSRRVQHWKYEIVSRMAVRARSRWNFKAENVRGSAAITGELSTATARGGRANKFTSRAENAAKEFTTLHSILLMYGMRLIFHKYDGFSRIWCPFLHKEATLFTEIFPAVPALLSLCPLHGGNRSVRDNANTREHVRGAARR